MKNAQYDSNLTDAQWAIITKLLPKPARRGRKPRDRRIIINAILYITKAGCQWRLLPTEFGPWKTVYHVFNQWSKQGIWAKINDCLRSMVRKRSGRRSQPTAAILDSQSVKSDPHRGPVGYDGGKKIKGRKRHMLVDTMGLIIGIWVTGADLPEREGGIGVIGAFCHCLRWLRKIFVDGGYSGPEFAEGVRDIRPLAEVEVVRRLESQKGFKVLHKRWIVERTFGWLMRHRRLVRDYEHTTRNAEAFALIAMIRIQLKRLG